MLSSFGTVDFAVMAPRDQFPAITKGRSGVDQWDGSIQLDTLADFEALKAYLCDVTVKLPLGAWNGVVRVDKGPGSTVLDVPSGKGTRVQKEACLVSIDADSSGTTAGRVRARVSFIIIGDPT